MYETPLRSYGSSAGFTLAHSVEPIAKHIFDGPQWLQSRALSSQSSLGGWRNTYPLRHPTKNSPTWSNRSCVAAS